MKLEYLKQQLEIVPATGIEAVYFDRNHIVNTERAKDYPYVFWDLNTFKSRMNWQRTSSQQESVTLRAYVMDYFDRAASTETQTKQQIWDNIRELFRAYLTLLNTNQYIKLTNLADMPNELYEYGLTVDAEIGVSFDVAMELYCNAEVET